jgi:cell division protein FtsX
VSQQDGLPIIDKLNYNQNKGAIDTLTRLIHSGQRLGLFLTALFILISIIITFNTIRLAIYISRDEIAVMRLVGASSKYVRGPFVVIGIMYGLIAAAIALLIFLPVTYYLGDATENFFTGINIFRYYVQYFPQIAGILTGAGIIVGSVSSYLAVRRYLKV